MPNTVPLPMAEWTPDLPDPAGVGSATVLNVYPKVGWSADGKRVLAYGPMHTSAAIYNPLALRCVGAAAYIDQVGAITLFAGDANDLYIIQAADVLWRNVSKISHGYTTSDEGAWRFTVFNGQVIAVNWNDPPQAFTLIGGLQFLDLLDTPPRGKYIAVVKNAFVVIANTVYGGITQNDRLQWSAAGNANDWPVPGTNEAAEKQAGSVTLHGPAGEITGIVSGLIYADALIFQKYGVQRLSYVGPPSTFTVLPIDGAHGCMAPDSIVLHGGIAYYWSDDGIYSIDGQTNRPLGANKVNRTVYDDLSMASMLRISGIADPKNQLIIWAYPSKQSPDGNPDRLLIYNWVLDAFTLCNISCELVIRTMTQGYTLAQLETVLGYPTLESVPYPLSSDIWNGGIARLGTFNTSHQLSFLEGIALPATIDTPEMGFHGRRQFISGVRPLIDDGEPTVKIGRRRRTQDLLSWTGDVRMNALGVCPVRTSAMYMRARVSVPLNTTWSEISGVEIDLTPQGRR